MTVIPRHITSPVPIADGGTGETSAPDAIEALGVGPTDSPTFVAINLGDTNLSDYKEGTFAPTVTLVGGTGNTVPQYTTNTGRYTRIGNRVFFNIELADDGGDEGAGTGQIRIALPIQSSASQPADVCFGHVFNNTSDFANVKGYIGPSSTTIRLSYASSLTSNASITGDLQNNATRFIRIGGSYEV